MSISLKVRHYLVLLLAAFTVQQARAAITLDLGSSGIATNQINGIAFSDLNGTPVNGSLSLDFVFSHDAFVRLFNQYTIPARHDDEMPTRIGTDPFSFDIGLDLQTSGSGLVGFLDGTGYITDLSGNPITGYAATGAASSDDGGMFIGLFPCQDSDGTLDSGLSRPLDFYGVHFDLLFPDAPSLQITGARFTIFDSGGEFGIGPNIPLDVPEPPTCALAILGVLLCALPRPRRSPRQATK
ncbi:MAG TPA: hypothetical protein VHH88_02620 [Verrucomicrobiae bacterium]|nr:hypothetical protein [Verrucomicrobiae bacterium]